MTLQLLQALMAAVAAVAAQEIRILVAFYLLPAVEQVLAVFLLVLVVYLLAQLHHLLVVVVMAAVALEVQPEIIMVLMVQTVYQEPMVQMHR